MVGMERGSDDAVGASGAELLQAAQQRPRRGRGAAGR
jgi:hypothetical protein